jgi:hypothetical protein
MSDQPSQPPPLKPIHPETSLSPGKLAGFMEQMQQPRKRGQNRER